MKHTKGILLAAPASGSGKTAAACALMAALKKRGMEVRACKCGPDYIDPMFHREVLGIDSKNLDLFFSEEETLRRSYIRHAALADLTVTEGVMGYYDGMGIDTDRSSSWHVAKTLGLPVILVLPARGTALTLAAVVKGMMEFRTESRICGILLNRISSMLYPRMKEMLETELNQMGCHIAVIGYIPEDDAFRLESRHLGLVTPGELDEIRQQLERAGEILTQTVDLDQIIRMAEQASDFFIPEQPEGNRRRKKIRIGVAKDRAFCFYYKDNLELLERAGCELVSFSPLKDRQLPIDLDGLLLGGGYPELYVEELSRNQDMIQSVRHALNEGMPCLAECGGFMYLHEQIRDSAGKSFPMVGKIRGTAAPEGRLVRFGYVTLSPDREKGEQAGYLMAGESIRGHEFHYWDSTDSGSDCTAVKPDGKRQWKCIHAEGNLFAGYPHLFYPSYPKFAERFVQRCASWKGRSL